MNLLFGYIKVHKDELKVKEYNTFKAYYCGLCFSIKQNFGNVPRIALSYDAAFLALLLSSVFHEKNDFEQKKCISNPLKNRPVVKANAFLDYASAVNVILTHYKLKDDLKDGLSVKAFGLTPFFLPSTLKAKKLYSDLFSLVGDKLTTLSELEANKCGDIDKVADTFASLLGELFASHHLLDEKTKRILYKMGYSLGRFIYILDAYDDLEEDKKKKRYNPFIYIENKLNPKEIYDSLIFTLSDVALSYELLEIKNNKSILDNIIYMGLADSLDSVFCKEKTSASADRKA